MVRVNKMTMKRLLITTLILALLVTPIVALASDISVAKYWAVIQISNNSTATINVATTSNISTTNLIDGNYINASANNCVLRTSSGADVPFMPGYTPDSNPWCIWVPSIGTDSYQSDILYTANSTGGLIKYFPGAGGMTTPDDDTLELGDNFTIEQKGWVDTTAVGANLTYKEDAFRTYISASGNITCLIGEAWNSPDGFADPGGGWSTEPLAYDNNVTTSAQDTVADSAWTDTLELTTTLTIYDCSKIRFYATLWGTSLIDIDVHDSAGWHDVYQGTYADKTWVEKDIPGGSRDIDSARVAFRNQGTGNPQTMELWEFDFWGELAKVTATGVSSGNHTLKTDLGLRTYTETFYPDATAADATTREVQLGAVTWATIIAAAGTSAIDIAEYYAVFIESHGSGGDNWTYNARGIYCFNTAALTDSANITVATLSIYGTGKQDGLSTSPDINIYTSNPTDVTAIAAGDYNSLDNIALCDTTITYGNWSTAGYNDFIFNATGRASVNQTGVSTFGAREVTHDVGGVTPNMVGGASSYFQGYFTEQGAGFQPKLVVTYTLPVLQIYVDNVVEDYTTFNSSVPSNGNNWAFMQNNVMPYMDYHKISVNGTLQQHIEWEYDNIFTDLSGNSNNATPTFRTASSDADVSAELVSFQPVAEAKAPDYVLGEAPAFISPGITGNVTGTFTTTPGPGTFPLAGVITAIANATETPPQLPLLVIAIFIILAASLSVSAIMRTYGSGSIFVKILVIVAVMGVFLALDNFAIDFWMLVVFLIIGIALGMASRQFGWT